MREILFRGKRKCDGEWVEGDLSYHVHDGDVYVFPGNGYDSPDRYEVAPETVCQYTGLTDKNGRKIFEGDIVKHFNYPEDNEKYMIGCIKWNQDFCKFVKENKNSGVYNITINNKCIYEVIGNIFDNPELLKG